jgi:DNA excision repair protein ERCC-2
MKFWLDDVLVYFPFKLLYTEQKEYMEGLKKILDKGGHGIIEMPTGTGKTVSLLSFILSYQLAHPLQYRKLVYCTRTFAELEKTIEELKLVVDYIQAEFTEEDEERIRKIIEQKTSEESKKQVENLEEEKVIKKKGWKPKTAPVKSRVFTAKNILAIGMSARRALCVHPEVSKFTEREKVDAECFERTAKWKRVVNEVFIP